MRTKNTIICNCCGKEIIIKNEIPTEEFLHIHKIWGYFSSKDGREQEMDICEACMDEWISRFKIPVKSAEITEMI